MKNLLLLVVSLFLTISITDAKNTFSMVDEVGMDCASYAAGFMEIYEETFADCLDSSTYNATYTNVYNNCQAVWGS